MRIKGICHKQGYAWSCDEKQTFTRTKSGNGINQSTDYLISKTQNLMQTKLIFLNQKNPSENGLHISKDKIGKQYMSFSTKDIRREFEIPFFYPNKSVGLSLHPKAYFPAQEGFPAMMIMHKYDKTLYRLLQEAWPPLERIKAISQVSQGIATLHSLKICHGDLCNVNVMWDQQLDRYDIIDFGMAAIFDVKMAATRFDISKAREEDQKLFPFIRNRDVKLLHFLIFTILNAKGYEKMPSLQDIIQARFKSDFAKRLLDLCQNLPSDPTEISRIFSQLQNETENMTNEEPTVCAII